MKKGTFTRLEKGVSTAYEEKNDIKFTCTKNRDHCTIFDMRYYSPEGVLVPIGEIIEH